MALTQMQIIQSLGEAMNWFERELNWGLQQNFGICVAVSASSMRR